MVMIMNFLYLIQTGKKVHDKIKYSVKFVARASGSTSIGLKQPYSVYSYTDSSEMSVSYSPLNILVKK